MAGEANGDGRDDYHWVSLKHIAAMLIIDSFGPVQMVVGRMRSLAK